MVVVVVVVVLGFESRVSSLLGRRSTTSFTSPVIQLLIGEHVGDLSGNLSNKLFFFF
jgi:hypothetical protein